MGLKKALNEHVISGTLKGLGQKGARLLHSFLLNNNSKALKESGLTKITLDADSTVSMVYGNQEGAKKGYNDKKQGAKSYHPLLVFVSELKMPLLARACSPCIEKISNLNTRLCCFFGGALWFCV